MQYLLTPHTVHIHPFAWWDGLFSKEELDWLQNRAKNANIQAKIGSGEHGGVNKEVRRSQINWVGNTADTVWIFKKLAHVASELNAEFFQFDLVGFGEDLQLTNYDQSENGMYGWHQDCGGKGISRKLSLVVQLSDPSEYEGGELQIMTGADFIPVQKQRGLIAAFPSYAIHQVTPVTKGSRQSLVAWISGPRFK